MSQRVSKRTTCLRSSRIHDDKVSKYDGRNHPIGRGGCRNTMKWYGNAVHDIQVLSPTDPSSYTVHGGGRCTWWRSFRVHSHSAHLHARVRLRIWL